MIRQANVMDLAGYAGVVIGCLGEFPGRLIIGLLGLGLVVLSGHLSPDPTPTEASDRHDR